MLKAGVTLGCAAAVIAAGVLTFWLRRTRRTPSPLSGCEPFGERLAEVPRRERCLGGEAAATAAASGLVLARAGGVDRQWVRGKPRDVMQLHQDLTDCLGELVAISNQRVGAQCWVGGSLVTST